MFVLADRAEWAAEYVPKEWKESFAREALNMFKDEEFRKGLTWEQGQWYLHFIQELGLDVSAYLWECCDELQVAANASPVFPGNGIRVNKELFVKKVKACWARGDRLTWEGEVPGFLEPFLHLRPKEKGLLDRLLEKL